jgi:NADH-quinone oxidoreductase subunit G
MLNAKIPRQTMRYSGRTAIHADTEVREAGVPQDADSPLAFSMEGQPENPPSSLVPFYWSPGWNSVQALYKYQDEPGGSMKGGDPGVRLLHKNKDADFKYFKSVGHEAEVPKGYYKIIPAYRIFGSEELSSLAPGIAQKTSAHPVIINSIDATESGISDGEVVVVELDDAGFEVTARVEDDAPRGTAGLTVGYKGMPYTGLPAIGKIFRK